MTSDNNLTEAASRLAYFILKDKEAAESSTAAALARLGVTATAQGRRYYYVPGMTAKAYGVRTKVTLSDSQLLQRLIYDEVEIYERDQERLGLIDEERLLIHFIKHLVWITVKRNSFYVTLGISRLLHHYTNLEAMELYGLIVQDPGRIKEYDYWRSRKGHLMKEMKDRFGDLIEVTRRAHNEERFIARDDSQSYAPFVQECLKTLMPWGTACPLPPNIEAVTSVIPSLVFGGGDPDKEHNVEILRIHAVLHADCFARLTAGLNLEPPDSRLEVPQFFYSQNHNRIEEIQQQTPQIDKMNYPDLNTIRTKLNEHEQLLKSAKPQCLNLVVSRTQRGTLDLSTGGHVNFTVNEGDDYIELRTPVEEGGVSLALYQIDYLRLAQINGTDEFTLALADGRKINFAITPQRDEYNELVGATVSASHQPSIWRSWQQFFSSLFVPSAPSFAYTMTAAVLLVSVIVGLAAWRIMQANSSKQLVATNPSPTESASGRGFVTPPPATADPRGSIPSPDLIAQQSSRSGNRQSGKSSPDVIRDPDAHGAPVAQRLSDVNQVYIEVGKDTPSAKAICEQLTRQLKANGRWEVASKEDTNAALNIVIKPDGRTYSFQMVNASGKIIWPLKNKWRVYSGDADQVAKQLLGDLLKDAR